MRFNALESNNYGIYCNCTSPLIQKNTAEGNSFDGFLLFPFGNGITVNQNILANNGGNGLKMEGSAGKINSNVMENNGRTDFGPDGGSGLYLNASGKSTIRGNIAFRNALRGLTLRVQSESPSPSVVKHNMSVSNSGIGIRTEGTNGSDDFIDFENNAAIGNLLDQMNVSTQFSSFTDNTTYGGGSTNIGINNVSGFALTIQNHFLGAQILLGTTFGTLATKPNLTKVGIAKGLGF